MPPVDHHPIRTHVTARTIAARHDMTVTGGAFSYHMLRPSIAPVPEMVAGHLVKEGVYNPDRIESLTGLFRERDIARFSVPAKGPHGKTTDLRAQITSAAISRRCL